jgi:hypothetical protein
MSSIESSSIVFACVFGVALPAERLADFCKIVGDFEFLDLKNKRARRIRHLHRGRAFTLFRATPPPSTQSPNTGAMLLSGQKRSKGSAAP